MLDGAWRTAHDQQARAVVLDARVAAVQARAAAEAEAEAKAEAEAEARAISVAESVISDFLD